MGIQVQILRIAEGSQHPAQIGRDILQDEHSCHVPLFPRSGKYQIPQRKKGDQRHIIGDQHRANEGDITQRNGSHAGISRQTNHFPGQNGKKVNVFQSADHGKRSEKAAERLYVKILGILRVRRHQKGGDRRRAKGNERHHVFPKDKDQFFTVAGNGVLCGFLHGLRTPRFLYFQTSSIIAAARKKVKKEPFQKRIRRWKSDLSFPHFPF